MENVYLLIVLALASLVFLALLFVERVDHIETRGKLAEAKIKIKFLEDSVIIREWCINSLKIYGALLKNLYDPVFIKSSVFQSMLIRELELFEKVKLFNRDIELDKEIMRGREIYACLMVPQGTLPS